MAITGLFPAMFSRNGYVRKKRQKNEITMDELNERINSANEEIDELEGYDEIVEVEKSEENEES
jgi:TolA-binding protein